MMFVPMVGLVLALVFTGGLCQCPNTGNTCPTTTGGGDCNQQVQVINRTILDDFRQQPVYYSFFSNATEFADIDNICVTLFPLKDNPYTLIYYYSIVYRNGSCHVETYITSPKSPGVNRYAAIDNLFSEYVFGKDSCGSYLTYSCGFSDVDYKPYVYGTTADRNSLPYGEECLQSAVEVIQSAGQTFCDYIALPYKLPTMCQTKHLCLPTSNTLYKPRCAACAPYEGSYCQC